MNEIFKFMTLGLMLAFGFTVLTHSSDADTILKSGFSGYNSTLTTIQGR